MTLIYLLLTYGITIHVLMERSINRKVDENAKVLLILGAQIKNNQVNSTLYSRLEAGARILKKRPDMLVIVSGGKGSALTKSEAEVMKDILVKDFGIAKQRIILEDQSTNSFENLLFTKSLIGGQKVAIITNEFHTIRVGYLARRVGINAQVIGAKTPNHKRVKLEIREHFAMIKSLFFDT